jgi:hypothetical protein
MGLDLFHEMNRVNPGIHFYCLIAPAADFADLQNESVFGVTATYKSLYDGSNVTFVPYPFPVNAFTNRYAFDPKLFLSVYKSLPKIDIVWNNIIELTRNIKTTLWQINEKPKIISCNYWLDAPCVDQGKVDKAISYDWRQFDGAECSDLVAFTCESTRQQWIENAQCKFHNDYLDDILEKSTIWDFGYSQSNIIGKPLSDIKYHPRTILFANRLSGINYTHHEEFINAVNELWKQRQDFQVMFTNPSQKVSNQWLKDNVKAYRELYTPLSRVEYFHLLSKCHVSCHLYDIELYGGCAHRECVSSEIIPVTPKVNEYARIQGDDYPFYCKTDCSDLIEVLNRALDASKNGYKVPQDVLERNKQSSFEVVVPKVSDELKKLMRKTS